MFILCKGALAKEPYIVPVSEVPVYSLEELCYYMYNNIYSITEEFFDERLVTWLREEVNCDSLSKKMEVLIQQRHDVKDLVVTLLCSCDYYKEEEVRNLVEVLNRISHLPPHKKNKIKADAYLSAGKYGKSLQEYKELLYGELAGQFTTEEYGNVLHNQAIALYYVSSYYEAARGFKEAYARNHRGESRDQYLYTLLLGGEQQKFEEESGALGMKPEETAALKRNYMAAKEKGQGGEEDFAFIDTCKKELRASYSELEGGQNGI